VVRCLLIVLVLLLVPSVAVAKPVPTCKSPRNAIEAVFLWQEGKQQSLANAAKCFERGGRSQRQLEESARRLKTVFDSQGAIVAAEKISDDPEFLDADKNPHAVANARYPLVFVEKREGRWVWTSEALDWIDSYYEDHFGSLDRFIDAIPDPLRAMVGPVELWQYAALALLLLVGTLVTRLLRAVLGLWMRRGDASAAHVLGLGRRLFDRATVPMSLAVSALLVRALYPELRLPVAVAAMLHLGVRLTWTLAAVLGAFRFADVFADGMQLRAERTDSRMEEHLIPIIRKSLKAASIFIGALALLQHLSIDVTALFATLGIGTLAVGLAAKDALANLFGSLSIFVDNPFKIGDRIVVDGVEGIVEEVGFRSTRVRTPYNSLVVLPNAKLADSKIDNLSKRKARRIVFTLHVVHQTSGELLRSACEALRVVVEAQPLAEAAKTEVVLSAIGGPALEITVTCFFRCEPSLDEAAAKSAVLFAALDRVRALGVALYAPPAPTALPAAADKR
jgi:MscS family membrane protein